MQPLPTISYPTGREAATRFHSSMFWPSRCASPQLFSYVSWHFSLQYRKRTRRHTVIASSAANNQQIARSIPGWVRLIGDLAVVAYFHIHSVLTYQLTIGELKMRHNLSTLGVAAVSANRFPTQRKLPSCKTASASIVMIRDVHIIDFSATRISRTLQLQRRSGQRELWARRKSGCSFPWRHPCHSALCLPGLHGRRAVRRNPSARLGELQHMVKYFAGVATTDVWRRWR